MKQLTKEDFFKVLGTDERNLVATTAWDILTQNRCVVIQSDEPQFKPGDKVRYTGGKEIEPGIIKSIRDDNQGAFVVYNCAGDWDHYKQYTGCSTNFRDLIPGWNG